MQKFDLSLPDFANGLTAYTVLLSLKQKHPEIFYEDVEISNIFGCFSGSIWNGGSLFLGRNNNADEIKNLIYFYNYEHNVPLRFTFTNPHITEKECYDTYSNLIAQYAHNGMNEILTVSPILEDYLRNTYPNFKYCRSIIGTHEQEYFADEKYYVSVMRRAKNNDWDYLNKIPQIERSKIEFLCNDPCPDNCPRIYSHYREYGAATLKQENNSKCDCTMMEVKGDFPIHFARTLKSFITRDMIINDYLPKGFKHFKLSGRGDIGGIINYLTEYMIRPEYQNDVRSFMINCYIHPERLAKFENRNFIQMK